MLEKAAESTWLDLDPAEYTDATPDKAGWALPQILGSSVSYRIAVGPQQGRKAFMIRTIRPLDRPDPGMERVAKAAKRLPNKKVASPAERHAAMTWAQARGNSA